MTNQRGRPKKQRDELHAERIELRTTTEEREHYERAATKAGLKLSAWIRDRLLMSALRETRHK